MEHINHIIDGISQRARELYERARRTYNYDRGTDEEAEVAGSSAWDRKPEPETARFMDTTERIKRIEQRVREQNKRIEQTNIIIEQGLRDPQHERIDKLKSRLADVLRNDEEDEIDSYQEYQELAQILIEK